MNGMTKVMALMFLASLAACGSESLEERDPHGFAACQQLISAREHDDDVGIKVGSQLAAAEEAEKAKTSSIKDALQKPIEGLEQVPLIDPDELEAACEEEDVDVPAAG